MSNYNFMKTGFTNDDDEVIDTKFIDFMESTMALLFSNAIESASRYVELADRNTLTKKDIEYAMKYAAMEFLKNPNLNEDIQKTSEELDRISEDIDDENNEHENDILIVDEEDNITDPFKEVDPNLLSNQDDIIFIKKMNHYYSYWDEWKPQALIEKHIKSSINAFS